VYISLKGEPQHLNFYDNPGFNKVIYKLHLHNG